MNKTAKNYEVDMTTGPVFGKLLAFALPLMLSGILQCLYNAADTIVVGRFAGEGPLAAVGATGSLVSLIANLFIGLSVGTSITVAVAIGARNTAQTERLVHTSMALALLSGAAVTAVGMLGAEQFLLWMDTPEDILDMATDYLRIYFAGSVFSMLYNFGAAILRAAGDSRRPLYFLMFSGILNVILNLVFVIALGMTADGVALATVISQAVSAALVLGALMTYPGACRFRPLRTRITQSELLAILRTGLPAGIQSVVFALSNTIIQSAINSFDTAAIAGNAAGANLDGFIYTAMYTFHTTAVTAIGQNVGAGKLNRIDRILFSCLGLVTVTGVLLGAGALVFGTPLLSIYLPDSPEAIEFALLRLSITATTYFFCGWMDTCCGASRGMGNTFVTMVVSIVGVVGVRLVWIFTVFAIPAFHTLTVLYISYPVSWFVTAVIQFVFSRRVKRRLAVSMQGSESTLSTTAILP